LREIEKAKSLMRGTTARENGVVYLEKESARISIGRNGRRFKVYGEPGSPRYGTGGFQYRRGPEAAALCAAIPTDTDILISHGPPHGTLDTGLDGAPLGCEELAARVAELAPLLHVFGHVHEGWGATVAGERVSVNAAVAWMGRAIIVDVS